MTTADKIADRFGNDGQRFTDDNGTALSEVLEACTWWTAKHRYTTIYVLDDDSMIVDVGDWWDVLERKDGNLGLGLYDSNDSMIVALDAEGELDWTATQGA